MAIDPLSWMSGGLLAGPTSGIAEHDLTIEDPDLDER